MFKMKKLVVILALLAACSSKEKIAEEVFVEKKAEKKEEIPLEQLTIDPSSHKGVEITGRTYCKDPLQLVTEDMKAYKPYFHVIEDGEEKYNLDNIANMVLDPKKGYSFVSLGENLQQDKNLAYLTLDEVPSVFEHKTLKFAFMYNRDLDSNEFLAEVYKITMAHNLEVVDLAKKKQVNAYTLSISVVWFDERPEGYPENTDFIFADVEAYFFHQNNGLKEAKNSGNSDVLAVLK